MNSITVANLIEAKVPMRVVADFNSTFASGELAPTYKICVENATQFDFGKLAMHLLKDPHELHAFKLIREEHMRLIQNIVRTHQQTARVLLRSHRIIPHVDKLLSASTDECARKLRIVAESFAVKQAAMFALLHQRRIVKLN